MAMKVAELKEELEARDEATSGNMIVAPPAAARGDYLREYLSIEVERRSEILGREFFSRLWRANF